MSCKRQYPVRATGEGGKNLPVVAVAVGVIDIRLFL